MASVTSSRGAQVIAWSYVTFSIAALFVSLRLVVRWKFVRLLGREDVCVIGALITALLCCIFMHLEVTRGGLGQPYDGPERFMEFLKMSYFSILFYNLSLCLTKFAILLLCIRIFAPSSWRYACYTVLGFISLYTTWIILNNIIACLPVPRYWDKSIDGWCFPIAVVWFTNAGLNIFTDFLIVCLPLPGIWKLQLPRKQKIGVSLVFLLGFIICIISIVRLYALHQGATTKDPTYDNFAIAIWSVVEVNGAIVGACLPTLKPLISRMFPGLLSSAHSRHRTNTYYRHGTGADGTGVAGSHSRSRRGIAGAGDDGTEPLPDFSSATQILGEDEAGVALSEFDNKSAVKIGGEREEYDISREHTLGRSRSSGGWSFERPIGGIGTGKLP